MRVYAVFEPPSPAPAPGPDLVRHAERFRFVRDGFSWPAFLITPLWMLRHRLWLALVIYVVILVALGFATARGRVPSGLEALVILMLSVLIGFEGATLRRRKLQRWGWRDLGIVVADNLQAAEQRFFDRWVKRLPAAGARVPPLPPAANPTATSTGGYDIGMVPTPGGSP